MSGRARAVPDVQVEDLRGQPHRLSRDEWSPSATRDPATLRGVVLHAWGVRDVGTEGRNRVQYGEPLALARRALAAPYGISCGVTRIGGVPVVAIAHPLERYTMASDAGNAHYLAVGVMGLFAVDAAETTARHTPVTDALRVAVDAALEVAVRLLAEHGGAGPFELVTHRQCCNGPKDHFACPGEAVVEMALASRSVASGLLVPDPALRLDAQHSRDWPTSWRRHLQAQRQEPVQAAVRHPDVRGSVVRDEA